MTKTKAELLKEGYLLLTDDVDQIDLISPPYLEQGPMGITPKNMTFSFKDERQEGRLLITTLPRWVGWCQIWERQGGPGERYRLVTSHANFFRMQLVYRGQEPTKAGQLLVPAPGPVN